MKQFRWFLFIFLISSAILYSQSTKVELIFSHKFHAQEAGVGCSDCHATAETSLSAGDNLLPDMETCYNCHDRESACTMCHKDPENAIAYPRVEKYIAKFPHKVHVEKEVACERCHAGVAASENIMDKHLPAMPVCSGCHDDLEKPHYCYDCHDRGESLLPQDHRLNWRKAHAIHKQSPQDHCHLCHTENQCIQCHKKDNLNRQAHPLNYIHTHGIYARGDKEHCYSCHEDRAFCIDCHRAQMVYPRSHASAGWAMKKGGGAHKRAAEADLEQCLSCHSDDRGDPICAQCHHQR